MSTAATIKPTHKAIQSYYDTLHQFSGQHVEHESAVRSAFRRLLEGTAKLHRWMLIHAPTIGMARHEPTGTGRVVSRSLN